MCDSLSTRNLQGQAQQQEKGGLHTCGVSAFARMLWDGEAVRMCAPSHDMLR
jgi:hypothetical protein